MVDFQLFYILVEWSNCQYFSIGIFFVINSQKKGLILHYINIDRKKYGR